MPVLSMLSNYITMIRPLNNDTPTNVHQQLMTLMSVCTYSEDDKNNLLETITD